jgi:hypothetical protein
VGVVAPYEIPNWLRFAEQITDSRSAVLGLGATNPDRHSSRDYGIVSRHDDGVISVERLTEALSRTFPVEGSASLGWGPGHGVPA